MKSFLSIWMTLFMFSFLFGCEESDEKAAQEASQSTARICSERATIRQVVATDNAKVNIHVKSLEYSLFELTGEGFRPYESLNLISNSCEEILHAQVTADKNGCILPIRLLPAVIGKSGGICHIDILRKEGSIHMKFPWGTEALKTN